VAGLRIGWLATHDTGARRPARFKDYTRSRLGPSEVLA